MIDYFKSTEIKKEAEKINYPLIFQFSLRITMSQLYLPFCFWIRTWIKNWIKAIHDIGELTGVTKPRATSLEEAITPWPLLRCKCERKKKKNSLRVKSPSCYWVFLIINISSNPLFLLDIFILMHEWIFKHLTRLF